MKRILLIIMVALMMVSCASHKHTGDTLEKQSRRSERLTTAEYWKKELIGHRAYHNYTKHKQYRYRR